LFGYFKLFGLFKLEELAQARQAPMRRLKVPSLIGLAHASFEV
jgi:hypothetical protein